VEFHGDKGNLTGMTIRNNPPGATEEIHPARVFIFIGQNPNSAFLKEIAILLDRWGYIRTGYDLVHGGKSPMVYDFYAFPTFSPAVPPQPKITE
jgi:thioredoxin reductase